MAIKKAKTKKPTKKTTKRRVTVKRKKVPIEQVLEEGLDHLSLQKRPITMRMLEAKAEHLVKWATTNQDALYIIEYYVANGVSGSMCKRWAEMCPKFKAAMMTAKHALSARKQRGALFKKMSERMVLPSLPFYSEDWEWGEDWKKLKEWDSDLKDDKEKQPTEFIIKMSDLGKPQDDDE